MTGVMVLRWGHRPQRDARLTTHVALTARALGAAGVILTDIQDPKIQDTIDRVTAAWGGTFSFQMGISWRKAVKDWKAKGGITVHLTAYGENIETSDVMKRIKKVKKDMLILVGSQKVPSEFFSREISDFNVAIGNQPHSECASLAVFLDRFFEGKSLARHFEKAKLIIMPQQHGKKIVSSRRTIQKEI